MFIDGVSLFQYCDWSSLLGLIFQSKWLAAYKIKPLFERKSMNYPYNVGLVTFCRCETDNYEISKEENADVLRLHNIPAVGFFNVHSTTSG